MIWRFVIKFDYLEDFNEGVTYTLGNNSLVKMAWLLFLVCGSNCIKTVDGS